MRSRSILASCSALAILASAAPVAAQESAAGAVTQDSFGEIIVTARKRDERLMDVPVAISALSAEKIERYSTDSFAAIAQQTPQLVIGEAQSASGGSINLRGVGSGTSNAATDQSVSINVDGIQVSQGNVLRLGQYDLQRVEVLKGPQALFYGKNSPGGIISLISKDPGKTFEASVRTGYEFNADQKFIEGIVSGPLGGGFGARLVGYYSKADGYFRNLAVPVAGLSPGRANKYGPGGEEVFVRGTLTYVSPDDALDVKLKINHGTVDRDTVGISATSQQFFCPTGTPQLGAGLTTDCSLNRTYTTPALDSTLAQSLHPTYGDGTPYFHSKQTLASLSINYALSPELTLSSVSGYYKIRESYFDTFTGTNIPAIAANADVQAEQITQELRLASDFDGPFNFLLGGFYQDGKFELGNPLSIIISPATILRRFVTYRMDTTAYSFFAQGRYELTDQIELSAGARYSHEKKELKGTYNATPFTIAAPRKKYHDFSPEVTLTYKPTNLLTMYASYREGFVSGGYNTTPVVLRSLAAPTAAIIDLSYRQTTVRGGEAGAKGYLFDRQLMFDVSSYYYKFKDLQLSAFDPVSVSQTTRNAGGSKVRGIEVNGTLRPREIEGLELRSSVAYNRATYSSFFGGCYGGQSVAAGCAFNPSNPASPGTAGTAANPFNSQNLAGRTLPRAPKWGYSVGFSYERGIAADLKGSIAFDANYMGSYNPDIEANPFLRQNGYWQLNGNVTIGTSNDGWKLSLIGRNLTNKLAVNVAAGSPLTGGGSGTGVGVLGDSFGSVIQPRAIMLQLKVTSALFGGN